MIDNLETLINHRKIDLSKISRDYHKYPLFRLRRNIYGKKSELIPKEELYYIYITCNCSEKETALFFNVLENNVRHDLTLYNIKKDIKAAKTLLRETVNSIYINQKFNKNFLSDLYINQNLTCKQLAEKLNISERQVKRLLKYHKINKPIHLAKINAIEGKKRFSSGSISSGEQAWLDEMEIPEKWRQYKIAGVGKNREYTFIVDGIDWIEHTVYEYLGDYWHGNPRLYKGNDINKVNKKRFIDLYYETLKRFTFFADNEFRVVYIWDSEYKNNFKLNKYGKINRHIPGHIFYKGDLI